MDKDRPSVVGKRNKKMLEVLLASVYSPVLFRCRKLLGDEQEAKQAAEAILTTLAAKRELLDDPDRLPQLLGQITAVCCMRARREMARRGVSGGADAQKQTNSFFPSKSLNSVQTAGVVLLLADALPDEERLCFYLHDLCGLSDKAISRLNGSSQERVQSCLHTAQRAISHQMKRYQEQGVAFAPFDSTQKLLNRFLSSQRSPEAAMVAARVLAEESPAKSKSRLPSRGRSLPVVVLSVGVGIAVLVLLVLLLWGMLGKTGETVPEQTTGLTLPTTAVTEETTVPTTQEPEQTTAATTEQTQTTAAAEETTPPETKAVAAAANTGGGTVSNGSSSGGWQPVTGPHEHEYVFVNASYDRRAGCENAGFSNQICILCRDVGTFQDPVNLPALGHNYQSVVYDPTTTSQGYTEYTCSRCGRSYRDNFVDPLPTQAPPETEAPEPTAAVQPTEPQAEQQEQQT